MKDPFPIQIEFPRYPGEDFSTYARRLIQIESIRMRFNHLWSQGIDPRTMKSGDILTQGLTESKEEYFDRRNLCIELLKTWKPESEKSTEGFIHASEFIKEAADTLGNRAAERDVQEERSMKKVVAVFNALHGTNLTEAQGWSFMSCLKMGRAVSGKFRKDDYVDMAAYAALEGECRSKNT